MLDTADVSQDFNSIAATGAVPALLVLLVIAGVVSVFVARRGGERSAFEWFVAFATLAPILAVTLFRGEVSLGFNPGGLTDWSGSDLASLSRDPLASSQFSLNVMLFVPAGGAWTWLTKRPGRTLGALVAGSFALECVQAVTAAGANDLIDLVSNSLGSLVGTGTALIVISIVGGRVRSLSTARRLQLIGASLVAVVLVTVGWFAGASQRQSNTRSAVIQRFDGIDLASIQEEIESDFDAVVTAVPGVRGDYFLLDDSVELRYPATFFGLHRCVYATWTGDEMAIRNASGDDCTRFLG